MPTPLSRPTIRSRGRLNRSRVRIARRCTALTIRDRGRLLAGDPGAATPLLREGGLQADTYDDPHALVLAASGAMFAGDDARALALFDRAVARARAGGDLSRLPAILAPYASLQMWTGRFASAATSATEGLRLARETGQENPATHHRAVLAWVAAVRGDEAGCRGHAEPAVAQAIDHRLGPQAAIASWALSLLDLGTGRPDQAYRRLEAVATAGPGEGHPVVQLLASADLVEVAVRTGQPDPARDALARLEGWTGHAGAQWAHALVARCRGLLAGDSEPDAADAHFAEALARHATGGRPFDTARTALLYGEALRRRRRRADARVQLRLASEGFDASGPGRGPSWPAPSCEPPARRPGPATRPRSTS
jgi:ATP/maltotriose-dependent transcriptional regulator MalT